MIQIIFKKRALTTYYLAIMTGEGLEIGFKNVISLLMQVLNLISKFTLATFIMYENMGEGK